MDEIKWILGLLLQWGCGGVVAGFVVWLLLRNSIPAYLTEKGKNMATKEDIGKITDLVKGVEHQYDTLLEGTKVTNQLRMAALERRLQAHQEAFTMWRGLIGGNTGEETHSKVLACQDWWEKNCLYLEPEVRQAFVAAYMNENMRQQFVDQHVEAKLIMEAADRVHAFPDILFQATKLPPLTVQEREPIPAERA